MNRWTRRSFATATTLSHFLKYMSTDKTNVMWIIIKLRFSVGNKQFDLIGGGQYGLMRM